MQKAKRKAKEKKGSKAKIDRKHRKARAKANTINQKEMNNIFPISLYRK